MKVLLRIQPLEARVPRYRSRIVLLWIDEGGCTTKVADTDPIYRTHSYTMPTWPCIRRSMGTGMASLRERLRRLEGALPTLVEIDTAELCRIANAAHGHMSYEDLAHFEAVSSFMAERPGETLLDCHCLLTSAQRRAISRYARAVSGPLIQSAKEPTRIFL